MALGVDNFCWHHWEEPAYNAELNLREGMKVCSKCGSVKGFHRYVPREYENLGLQAPDHPVVSIASILAGFAMLVVGVIIFATLMPILKSSVQSYVTTANLPPGPSAALEILPLVAMGIPAIVVIVGIVSFFRRNGPEV